MCLVEMEIFGRTNHGFAQRVPPNLVSFIVSWLITRGDTLVGVQPIGKWYHHSYHRFFPVLRTPLRRVPEQGNHQSTGTTGTECSGTVLLEPFPGDDDTNDTNTVGWMTSSPKGRSTGWDCGAGHRHDRGAGQLGFQTWT